MPRPQGGFLNDYVPFYFTPFSVMMKNMHSGWGGIKQRANEEIAILVSSMRHIDQQGLPYLFTDCHAYYQWADFYDDLADLDKIDWPLLQQRNFKRNPDDPAQFERYQAEALIHRHVPISGLVGIVCYNTQIKCKIEADAAERGLRLAVHAFPGWYF